MRGDNHNDELELLEGLRAGNRAAMQRFVQTHESDVFHLALGILGNRQDAEDAMQDTFIKAINAVGRFRGASALSTWLYRITVNTCREQLRKRRWKVFSLESQSAERAELVDESAGADPLSRTEGREINFELMRALEHLSTAERQVFALRKFQELSVAETATVLGIAEGSVKSLLFRALRKLRIALEPMMASNPEAQS